MARRAFFVAGIFFIASTIAASAGGIGFGITIGPGAFAPGLHSAPPSREYRPSARTYHEEASKPRRQHRQNSDDDAKAAETPASHANESSSIAALSEKPGQPDLRGENSSIAGASHSVEPASSVTATAQLENSSIARALSMSEPAAPAPIALQAQSPVAQAASSPPVLCSRYYPTAGRTVQGPCD